MTSTSCTCSSSQCACAKSCKILSGQIDRTFRKTSGHSDKMHGNWPMSGRYFDHCYGLLSKITDSYVASIPGLPHIIAFSIHSWHFWDHQCFFRTSNEVWQKVFPEFNRFSAITSHKSSIAFQKCDGHIYIYTHTYNTCCYLGPLSVIQCLMLRCSAIKYAVTFDPQHFEAGMPKQGIEQVSEVTEWVTTF